MPLKTLRALPSLQGKRHYDRLFTPLVTLWYFMFQRLDADHSLAGVMADAQAGGGDRLNRKLSRQLRSSSTASYSDARHRLPWQFLKEVLRLQGQKIVGLRHGNLWHGRVLALLDGSIVRLRSYPSLPEEFPPQRHKGRQAPYWCLMRVVAAFCASTGAALNSLMSGCSVGEPALACQLILEATTKCLFIGDRAFGIFRVVRTACSAEHDVLLRLTNARAKKVLGRRLTSGDHAVSWEASRKDQLPDDCSKEPVNGRLLIAVVRRKGCRPIRLCLFTTLPQAPEFSLEKLMELYGLRVKSPDMARKEWLAGLLAYNLVRGAQLCAAMLTELSPLNLSFSDTRRHVEAWLRSFGSSRLNLLPRWTGMLCRISKCALPRRRKARPNEPRAQRHLRLPYRPLYGSRAVARRKARSYNSKS